MNNCICYYIPTDNCNGIETLLGNGVNTFSINDKQAVINGLRKLTKPPFWLVIFLVVPVNKSPLFSKDLFTFIMSFASLFVRVIPEALLHVNFLLSSFVPLLTNYSPAF